MRNAALARGTTDPSELTDRELTYFCEQIERLAGIALKPAKHDLVRTRLRARLIETGLGTYAAYRDHLEGLPPGHAEWQAFINLLTTNKTDFFREAKHFEFLVSRILPAWLATDERVFRAWSAASSTGEEASTLAMVLDRHLPEDRDYRILATDIDTEVLATAANAVYPVAKRPEIPPEYQSSGIDLGRDETRDWFRIRRRLRERIEYRRHNLVEGPPPEGAPFDLVLCRNVLIYFGRDVIERVDRKLFAATKPNGHLFIGHSESLQGIPHRWTGVGPSVFRKGPAK